MTEADADSAFEPYFPTRGPEGTGLGLATIRGIVCKAHGFIDLDTKPDGGTTVTIYLPAAGGAPEQGPPIVERRPDGPAVLLIEDKGGLSVLLREFLKASPCQLYDAGSAEEALKVASDPGDLDLLITDVRLPGATGYELAERLEEQSKYDPEIIFMSGYTKDDPDRSGKTDSERRRFIRKPFDPDELSGLVEQLLADNGGNDFEEPDS